MKQSGAPKVNKNCMQNLNRESIIAVVPTDLVFFLSQYTVNISSNGCDTQDMEAIEGT